MNVFAVDSTEIFEWASYNIIESVKKLWSSQPENQSLNMRIFPIDEKQSHNIATKECREEKVSITNQSFQYYFAIYISWFF